MRPFKKNKLQLIRAGDCYMLGDSIRIPLYLCEYKLRSLFDQCLFGLVEVVTQESRKRGRKVAPEIGIGNLFAFLGIQAKLSGEGSIETGTSKEVKQTISPILQLALLLGYFQKSKEVVVELKGKDALSILQPNSLVRFTAIASIVGIDDKPPDFLISTHWDAVKSQLRFEIELEKQSHVAWVAKLYDRIVVATISMSNITPHGERDFFSPTTRQHLLARFMGDRSGALFMDPICIWLENPI